MIRSTISRLSLQTKGLVVLRYSTNHQTGELEAMKTVIGKQHWDQSFENLKSCGFSAKQVATILYANPSVAKLPTQKIQQSLNSLSSLGYKTNEIKEIVVNGPQILSSDPHILKRNYLNILRQLGDIDGRVAAQLAPNVLLENEITTNEKIAYCILEMRLSKTTIAKSKILQSSFLTIRTRHTFAYRSGYYKKLNPKDKEAQLENPSIPSLIFSSTEKFLALCKGLTMEEYVVFESMISEEEKDFNQENKDSDLEE